MLGMLLFLMMGALTAVGQGETLMVSDVLPAAGSTEIATDAVLTVIFNQPVAPLGLISDDSLSLSDPLRVQPETAGEGQWINTFIYQFTPMVGWGGGTTYTATIDVGLVAPSGARLAEPFTWSFSTVMPRVIEVVPVDGAEGAGLNQPVQIRFNQAMDRASTEASFRLRSSGGGEIVSGQFEWADDNAGFRFMPATPLALDTRYAIQFSSITGLPRSAGGGAELAGPTETFFRTVPMPSIISTSPRNGQADAYPYGGLTLFFASPMNLSTLRERVQIEPTPEISDFDTYFSEWDNSYTLAFPTYPDTTYTVTLLPGMEDVYGNATSTTQVITFTTTSYSPDLILETPSRYGFYNADNPETRLFLRHMNVDEVTAALYRVETEDAVRLLTDDLRFSDEARTSLIGGSEQTAIKRWAIPSTATRNAYRFELLSLGVETQAACPDAPLSRVQVGDEIMVITEPDTLNIRSAPLTGEVLNRVAKGYRAPVIGGPACQGGYTWWQVQMENGTGWLAEGDATEYFIDVAARSENTGLALTDEAGAPLPRGMYYFEADTPQTRPLDHVLIVGNANLLLKTTVDSAMVWATDATTGQPVAGASVALRGEGNAALGQGVTDQAGLLRLELPRRDSAYALVVAVLDSASHFGIASSEWDSGIASYYFSVDTSYYSEDYRAYLYTDRPVYRPGQPMYFRGVVRAQDDVNFSVPGLATLPVRIINPAGEVMTTMEMSLSAAGTFSGQFDISPDAELGYYRLDALLPGEDASVTWSSLGTVDFGVAEYRLPEFQVTVTPDEAEVSQGETIRAVIDSRYYFGGAVSGATVEYSIVRSFGYSFEGYRGPGRFNFADYDGDTSPRDSFGGGSEVLLSGEAVTDERGLAIIEVPADLGDARSSRAFTIEATVTDESGQAVSGRANVTVHRGDVYIGVAPRDYVVDANSPAAFDLIVVDWAGQPVAGQAIDLQFVERRWSSVQELGPDGRTTWQYEVEEIPAGTGTVVTDAEGRAMVEFTPPSGGTYKLKASTRDGAGRVVTSAATTWVSSQTYVAWRVQNSNRIDLVANQEDYLIGDTAEILIASPFQGTVEALVTVERGDVMRAERLTLTSNSTVYRLPIEADFAPNATVSVFIVKGVDDTNPVAAFRLGMVQLNVETTRRELTIAIEADQDTAGPGETVTYTLTTTNYAGEPVPAEIGVALTDVASLSIAAPNQIDLLTYFFKNQGLAVRTAATLTINVDALTQYVLDTVKGGGGGFGEGGIFDIREDFVDTAYWNGAVVTDAQGRASVSITLPDNLTTWRLDARAISLPQAGDLLVGSTTQELLSTKPVLVRPVTPRFFVRGDEVRLGAIVNNNTQADLEVDVSLANEAGLVFLDPAAATQRVTVPAGTRRRVDFPVRVDAPADLTGIDLLFTAVDTSRAYSDATRPTITQGEPIPVLRYNAPEVVGTAGVLDGAGERIENISLPLDEAITGTLDLRLDYSLAASTVDALEVLRNFPQQCIEQTVSRFLPNIMTLRALEAAGLADEALRASLIESFDFARQKLYAEQRADGGWGWYYGLPSSALTTAYAVIGLAEARTQGFEVSDRVISNAQSYLRNSLLSADLSVETWQLNRQAFILYALARSGAPEPGRIANLFEVRERLSLDARAFLALALAESDPADARAATLLSDLVSRATLSATGAYWSESQRDYFNWNTDTRTTAIALAAFVRLNPTNDLIPNIVRYLVSARTADAWETTQETAWAVMALTDYMVATDDLNPNYSYTVTLNEAALLTGEADGQARASTEAKAAFAELVRGAANTLAVTRGEGSGNLYYRAFLNASIPVEQVDPIEDRGVIIQRRYVLNGETVTSAQVGDTVQVRLAIIVPNDLHYALIQDPIPAGTDAVDPRLLISQQIETETGFSEAADSTGNPYDFGWGWWLFDDIQFYDDRVEISVEYLPAGSYEYVYSIRAGLPGTYQVIPPSASEFYFPDVFGRGAGSTFTIRAAGE